MSSASSQADVLMVTGEKDIRYLTGFIGHDSILLVTADSATIITDPRYDEFLDPWKISDSPAGVVMGVRHRLGDTVRDLCSKHSISHLALQADQVTVIQRQSYETALSGITLIDTTGMVNELRMCKDGLEVETIERAIRVHHDALTESLKHLKRGMTELEYYARLDYEMKLLGAIAPSFDAIIGAGANSSVIHYLTGHAPIDSGPLLVDSGCLVDGYCSDITRTFSIGGFDDKFAEIYDIVLEAQQAAIAAAGPGKACKDIDRVARDVIERAGYGDCFGHGLGHGLGMDVHESPFFYDGETAVLLPGMVMTFEPGIYLPGVGGVRIEEDVLITDTGTRVLSNWPNNRDSAAIEFAS